LHFAGGNVRVIESGTAKTGFFTYVTTDVFSISRIGSIVLYKNGSTLLYTSLIPSLETQLIVDSSLYSGGDEIIDASVTQGPSTIIITGDIKVPAPFVIGGDVQNYANIVIPAPIVSGRIIQAISINITAPAPIVLGGRQGYIEGRINVPAPKIDGGLGLIVGGLSNYAEIIVPAPFVVGNILVGNLLTGNIIVPAPIVLSGPAGYVEGKITIPAPIIDGGEFYKPGDANTFLSLSMPMLAEKILDGTMQTNLNIAFSANSNRIVDASIVSPLSLSFTTNAQAVYNAIASASLNLNFVVGGVAFVAGIAQVGVDKTNDTWVVNMETLASSQYDGFGFNSFAFDGNRYLAAADDGIYELNGIDYAGSPILNTVQIPKMDFGTAAKKRVINAYIGVSSGNKLILKIETEGQVFLYESRGADPSMQNQRFDIGKGLTGNYWVFTLLSSSAFELESIKFLPLQLSRNI
jgi:hypothetical protein